MEVGTDGILSKSIVVEKVFDLDSIVYNYENKFELAMVHSEEPSKLRISNFLCEKEGNRLKKLIQIDYQGKRFVI